MCLVPLHVESPYARLSEDFLFTVFLNLCGSGGCAGLPKVISEIKYWDERSWKIKYWVGQGKCT